MKILEPVEKIEELEDKLNTWSIVLYNDNVNTFEDVVLLLIMYCGHEHLQAEQCALVAHTKGKYAVKHGSREEMEEIATALAQNGLTVEVE
jgi:ATP-dependent Clp protease adaptor protein ClpS